MKYNPHHQGVVELQKQLQLSIWVGTYVFCVCDTYVCSGGIMEATVRFLPLFYLTWGTESLRVLANWLASEPLCILCPHITRVTGACCHSAFLVGVGDLDLAIHACVGQYPLNRSPDLSTGKRVRISITFHGPTVSNF